ncbi:hypothetical protein GJAV_G00243140 [Gymnothorax javanicus]|nr:hypothetical protein GJAV_G00243140 [Gymnothorax javanicus]
MKRRAGPSAGAAARESRNRRSSDLAAAMSPPQPVRAFLTTATAGEAVENHSSTGDSGIDSPRTGPCLPSGGTDGGDAVKQRAFLQDLERLQAVHSQNPLLQLTPTMNSYVKVNRQEAGRCGPWFEREREHLTAVERQDPGATVEGPQEAQLEPPGDPPARALEFVLMTESETECDTPGLDTLGSECVIPHSQVTDVQYQPGSDIMGLDEKREGELHIHGGELKVELGSVTCVEADQIITETDHDYIKVEHQPDLHCFAAGDMAHQIKCVSNESLLGDLMKNDKGDPQHCAGELTVETENGVVIHEGLQCNDCGLLFANASDLHHHYEIHKAITPYICAHCGETFAVDASLKEHLKIHKKGVDVVGKGCIDPFNLKPHQMMHSADKPHRCSECGKSFAAAITLREHMKMHTEDKPYKCPQCRKSFIRRRHLKKHQEMHVREKPFSCPQCGKCFATASNLKQHQRTHSGDNKPHRCGQCGKGFAAASTLREHQRIHSGEKPYKCNQCRKSFVRRRHLKKHQQLHTGQKRYTCAQCNKSFNHSSSLSRHHRKHQDDKMVAMPQLPKGFVFSSPIKVARALRGEKSYSCNHCEKSFNHSSSLSRHQKVHSDGKTYSCSHCGKRFNHSSSLARHQRTHLEDKPTFAPPPATKPFTPPTVIKRQHLLDSEKPYRCSQCGKGFNHSSSLSRHHRIHNTV